MFKIKEEELLPLLKQLSAGLTSKKQTIATAESCTGGLLASLLTYQSGSSLFYVGGIAAYSNSVKTNLLQVPSSTIESFGVYSAEVAQSMAVGVALLMKSDYAIATTGIADQASGDSTIPAGAIWCGYLWPGGTASMLYHLNGDRTDNRATVVRLALNQILSYI